MKMTLEDHRNFGEAVKVFRETIMLPAPFCVGNRSSRESKAVMRTLDQIDRLKSVMDDVVCRDFPKCEDATRIYYGASKASAERDELKKEPLK